MKISRVITVVLAAILLGWTGVDCAEQKYPPLLDNAKAYFTPTESQKLWALATCAVLTERNGGRHDMLGGYDRSPKEIETQKDILAKWWNIHNQQELLKALDWIEKGGHRKDFNEIAHALSFTSSEELARIRIQVANNPSVSNKIEVVMRYKDQFDNKSITAWDFSRYISLCGWGYIVGYLTEDEAWVRIMPAARLLQKTFASWEDMGTNYLAGRELWSLKQTTKDGSRMQQYFEKLKTDPASPWKRLDWNMNLDTVQTDVHQVPEDIRH